MKNLRFTYVDAKGHKDAWEVEKWKESGNYIKGMCVFDDKYRTFRKDRVVDYLDDAEPLLRYPRPAPPPPVSEKPDILFTGFAKARRAELEQEAASHGLNVRTKVTKKLIYLCCGSNAGPTKVEGARDRGAFILSEESFKHMLETGEIQDEEHGDED